jgi:flagellar motor switch/type III secretory pathway protein FliN
MSISMTKDEDRWQQPVGEAMPLASDHAGEATLALARAWSRLSRPVVVPLRRIGEIQVQPDGIAIIDESATVPIEDMAWFGLTQATEQAWLGISFNVCHGLIRTVLGGAVPMLIRPFCPAEQGLMAAIVFSALSALGLAHRMSVAPGGGRPRVLGRQVMLTGAIRGASEIDGRAAFVGPLSWLADGKGPGPLMAPAENATVQGVLELGRALVPAADLDAAKPGDAVVFDATPGLIPESVWRVNLLVGRSWVSARFAPDNSLTLDGSWAQIEENATATPDEVPRWKPFDLPAIEQGLVDGSREVVAELGRIVLCADELAELSSGASLSLGPRPSDLVHLRVGGQVWAAGGLVILGQQLGIRILRLNR